MHKIMRVSPTLDAIVFFMQLSDECWRFTLEWVFEENNTIALEDYVNEELRS